MSIFDRFRLDGRVAIITGAGRGIGSAIAKTFAEAGADIVLASRTLKPLQATGRAIESMGARAMIVQTNVMHEDQLRHLADRTMTAFGRIDILVNNAGGFAPKPTLDTTPREFENAFRFNVSSAFALTRMCAPLIVQSAGGGSIINISSMAGHCPAAGFAAYGTVKSALSYLTKELAQDFAPKVRVNAIAAGSVRTDALNTVLTPEIEQTMTDLTPMSRLGHVEDIALGALYLASPAAAYVTGEILSISGGMVSLNMEMPRAFSC